MRADHDSSTDRLEVAFDVAPIDVDDLSVAVGSRRLRIAADGADRTIERTIVPPGDGRVFTDERRAIYNNGVLTVTVGTASRGD